MRKKLILLCGKKQVGKSTFASFFEEKSNNNYIDFALADELKEQLKSFLWFSLDIPRELLDFYSPEKKEKSLGLKLTDGSDFTVRKALQWYGQIMKQTFGQNFWVEKLTQNILNLYDCSSNDIIISDCRFKYEIEQLQENFYDRDIFIVKIIRPELKNDDNDISETDLDDLPDDFFDIIMCNDSTEDYFLNSIENIYNYINN